MATRIRLRRVGRRKQASFRIVVSDGEHAPVGRFTEQIGKYNPRTRPSFIEVDEARALYWLRQGAQPSDTVRSLFRRTGLMKKFAEGAEPAEGRVSLGDVDGRTVFTPGSRGEAAEAAPAAKTEPAKKPAAKAEAEAKTAEAEEAEAAEAEAPEAEAETEAKVEAKQGADEAEAAAEEAEGADDDAAESEEASEKES